MSALDFGARGMAMQARAAAERLPSLNTPALLALAQGQQRPVDLVCIGDSVQLGVHASFRAADEPLGPSFFTRRPDAVRCAFR